MEISKMTLTELQDYALTLEEEKTALENSLEAEKQAKDEYIKANLALQNRNNQLFMRLEQQRVTDPEPAPQPEPEPEESFEDFAMKLQKEHKII